jgi:hypothetical protein
MKRMRSVLTWMYSCCGCLRPPCGGTLQTVPSRILSKSLLHAFAGDVAGDADVLGLAADLVDFVDVDDAHLGALHVVVGGLEETQDDVLDVFTDVAGFRQSGRIGDAERHVEHFARVLREERLARAGRTDEEDVALLDLDVFELGKFVVRPHLGRGRELLESLVVVVHRDGEHFLGVLLPDHILIELGEKVFGLGNGELGGDFLLLFVELFFEDAAADIDAPVTDVDPGTGDEFFDFSVALSAEGTHREI